MTLQKTVRRVIESGAETAAAVGTRAVLVAYWGTIYVLSGRRNSVIRQPGSETSRGGEPSDSKKK
jgi:hypothetical protein